MGRHGRHVAIIVAGGRGSGPVSVGIGFEYCLLLGNLGRRVDVVLLEDILEEVAMLRIQEV